MYTLAPAPQQLFISPDDQALASNGFVWFYRDADRTTIKPVYRNTGTPGNPVYTQVELNPDKSISLTASGSFPFFIYYYPFDAEGNYDLYYVVAKTSDGIEILAEGNYPTLNDIEIASQIRFFINSACGAADLSDQTQLAESVSQYAMVAPYFVDNQPGVANVYVANRRGGENEEIPCNLPEGLRVRFLPTKTNTGPSTFTFTTKQGTTTFPIYNPITGSPLVGGEIEGTDSFQPTIELEWQPNNLGGVWFLMATPKGASPTETYKVLADASDESAPGYLNEKISSGPGITMNLSDANEHVQVNFSKYVSAIEKVSVTSEINSSVTSGYILSQLTVNFAINDCDILLKAIIPSFYAHTGPNAFAIFRIHDGTTILCQSILGDGGGVVPYSSASLSAFCDYTGTAKTFYLTCGVYPGSGAQIDVMTPNLFPSDVGDFIGGTFEAEPYIQY